jgi:hypothetical protein
MWDSVSFIVGLLAGFFLCVIIVWILYATRSFVFTGCVRHPSVCRSSDYYNDPGDALAAGAKISDILFRDADGNISYKRVQKHSNCVPSSDNVTVPITHPEYCSFLSPDGARYEGKNLTFESPVYTYIDSDNNSFQVMTDKSCKVVSSMPDGVTAGMSVLRWDANPQFKDIACNS